MAAETIILLTSGSHIILYCTAWFSALPSLAYDAEDAQEREPQL